MLLHRHRAKLDVKSGRADTRVSRADSIAPSPAQIRVFSSTSRHDLRDFTLQQPRLVLAIPSFDPRALLPRLCTRPRRQARLLVARPFPRT